MLSLSKQKRPQPASQNQLLTEKKVPNLSPSQSLGATNQIQQYFSFKIQNLVDINDPSLAWSYNVPVLRQNQKQIFLLTERIQSTIIDFVGDNFPQSIFLTLKNFSGLINQLGQVTSKIIALNLTSISIKNSNGLVTRDLLYSSDIVNNWNLGSLRQLRMEIYLDQQTEPLKLPLSNPLNVSFKILHIAY